MKIFFIMIVFGAAFGFCLSLLKKLTGIDTPDWFMGAITAAVSLVLVNKYHKNSNKPSS